MILKKDEANRLFNSIVSKGFEHPTIDIDNLDDTKLKSMFNSIDDMKKEITKMK